MAETGTQRESELRFIPEPTSDLMSGMLSMLHFAAPGSAVHSINIRPKSVADEHVLDSTRCRARVGDLIYFINKTECTAQSQGLVPLFGHELTIEAGGVAGEKVPEGTPSGSYPYQMFVNGVSIGDEDGTMPEIIIDD